MTVVRLTRVVQFSAAHRYYRPEWSAEENRQVFGACVNDHGHRYTCGVTVRGTPDPTTGMLINLAELDRVLREEVSERFDHKHLNLDVSEFGYGKIVPTVESLAVFIWERVAGRLPDGVALERVRVEEDPTLSAEYQGG